jgi:hypothetical protein
MPVLDVPTDPPTNASRTETRIWEKEVDEHVKRKMYLQENTKTLYSLVWGQCTDVVRARLEAIDTHKDMSEKADSIKLLKEIRALVYNFQSQKYGPHALHEGKRRFYLLSQDKHSTCQVYLERFQNGVDVIEHCGGSIGQEPGLVQKVLQDRGKSSNTATADETREAQNAAQQQYLAVAFLLGSDRNRYGKLLEDLENDYTQGQDNYPKTVTAAYSLLTNWKQNPRNVMRILGPSNDGVSFANVDDGEEDVDNEVNFNKKRRKGSCVPASSQETRPSTASLVDTNVGAERNHRQQQNQQILSHQQNAQQFFQYQRMQQNLQYQRMQHNLKEKQKQQILQHESLIGKKIRRHVSFVHSAAKGIGTTTPNEFDHILFLFFQGGILPHGPDPGEKRNRSLITRVAELSTSDKLGHQFWSQYSISDAAIVRRILGAIHLQETKRLVKEATRKHEAYLSKYESVVEAAPLLPTRKNSHDTLDDAIDEPCSFEDKKPASIEEADPKHPSAIDDVLSTSNPHDTMDVSPDLLDSMPGSSNEKRITKTQNAKPASIEEADPKHPSTIDDLLPTSNPHDKMDVSPDLEDSMSGSSN